MNIKSLSILVLFFILISCGGENQDSASGENNEEIIEEIPSCGFESAEDGTEEFINLIENQKKELLSESDLENGVEKLKGKGINIDYGFIDTITIAKDTVLYDILIDSFNFLQELEGISDIEPVYRPIRLYAYASDYGKVEGIESGDKIAIKGVISEESMSFGKGMAMWLVTCSDIIKN